MLIIDNATVSHLLTMEDCIRVQEAAFRKLPSGGISRTSSSEGRSLCRLRQDCSVCIADIFTCP